jgi:uncharacterized Zn finger protein
LSDKDVTTLKKAIGRDWARSPGEKARRYVGQFYDCKRIGTRIVARVEGNHGTYTVSIRVDEDETVSACSCYIGKGGACHHCAALAVTFLNDPGQFAEVRPKKLEDLQDSQSFASILRASPWMT